MRRIFEFELTKVIQIIIFPKKEFGFFQFLINTISFKSIETGFLNYTLINDKGNLEPLNKVSLIKPGHSI